MMTSKSTSKAQTTIPQAVRIALGLRHGDEIAYEIVDGRVVVTRAKPHSPEDDPFGALHEWLDDHQRGEPWRGGRHRSHGPG